MSAARSVVVILVAAVLTLGACNRDSPPAPPDTSTSPATSASTATSAPSGTSAPPATFESPASAPSTERVVGPLTPVEAQALATMASRLKEYIDLHTKLEQSLPSLPKEPTPEQVDKHQRAFEGRIREARATAKPGDIFTPEARPVIKRLLAAIFGGPDGQRLKSSIMDENPVDPVALKLTVNRRYPDEVPVTTVPPQVLQTLPKLPEDLEYRFVGDWLILLDTRAHVIADFIDDALP
jgi:hypothetical protein